VLADPQSVTIAGAATSLPRLEERANTHVYSNRASGVDLYVSQTTDKNGTLRSSISLVKTTIVTDALTGLQRRERPSVNVSFQQPEGTTTTTVEDLYAALTNALEASTNSLLKKVTGGEK
jgi:hypothetical protein